MISNYRIIDSKFGIFLLFISLSLLFSSALKGQQAIKESNTLTLEECIAKAMESNYSVLISGNSLEIAKNNVTLKPFLPSLSLSSRFNDNNQAYKNYTQTGEIDQSRSQNTSISNGLNASWRLFDGFAMYATREKQQELLQQGEYNFRSVVENLIISISTQYYKIITLNNQVELLTELLSISQVRYNQALTRYNIGADSGLEYKQAKIYLNSDSSSLMLQRENLKNAYIELYSLMNISLESDYVIKDTIVPGGKLSLEALLGSALNLNTSLNMLKSGERVSEIDLKAAKAARYPTLDFVGGYNYNYNRSQLMPDKFNQTDGLNWGFSLSLPIFDGLEINRKINNARLTQKSAEYSIKQAEQKLESDLRQLYNLYGNNLRSIGFEEESRESAYLNLEAAMEKYRLGSLSGIEFRDYQISYLQAADRKLRALYDAKLSEIRLKLMSGELIK